MTRSQLKPLQSFFPLRIPSIWDEEDWPMTPIERGLEIFETDSEIVVKASVPGVKPEDIDITYEEGVLRIIGRSEEKEEEREKKKVIYQSHRATSFNYSTSLPRMIDGSKITAEVDHGVVTITAPLAEEAKPRKIAVSAKTK